MLLSKWFEADELELCLPCDLFWLHFASEDRFVSQHDDDMPYKQTSVSGQVSIKLKKPRPISKIKVSLRCDAKLLSQRAGTVSSELVHRDIEQDIDQTLPAGDHTFAFTIFLPVCSPTTVKSRHGSVTWSLDITACSPSCKPLKTSFPLRVYKRFCLYPGEAMPIIHRIGGQADALGLYRIYLASDGHVGGRWTYTLFLPMSAPEVQIWSMFAYIRQHEAVDRTAAPRDNKKENIEEPLPMIFPLFKYSLTDLPKRVDWPQPGLEGCEFSTQGRLPAHDAPLCSSAQDLFQFTTSSRTQTPLRITHDIVIGFEYSTAPFQPLRRVEFPKSVSFASCEVVGDEAQLPDYCQAINGPCLADTTYVPADATLCACKRKLGPLPTLCGRDIMEGELAK